MCPRNDPQPKMLQSTREMYFHDPYEQENNILKAKEKSKRDEEEKLEKKSLKLTFNKERERALTVVEGERKSKWGK